MNLIRYEPWALPREVLDEFNRFFDRFATENDAAAAEVAEWSPSVDVTEYADKYVLAADLPGVDPAAIDITLEKGVLTLSGARAGAAEQNGVESRRLERVTGRFVRRFTLPESADTEAVSASGKHGVLEIVIPKREASKARRITVNA